MANIVSEFFSCSFENEINKDMLYYDYKFPYQSVLNYIDDVVNISLEEYVDYVLNNSVQYQINTKDIFQFSKLEDATSNLCKLLKAINDPGITFLAAGKMLENDGKERNDVAYRKYGENHLKAAEAIGLVYSLKNTYFLTCLGFVFNDLSDEIQKKFIVRLVLRNLFVRRILQATKNGEVNMRQLLYMIADTTYTRRKGNIRDVINLLTISGEYDFSIILAKIKFNHNAKNNYECVEESLFEC